MKSFYNILFYTIPMLIIFTIVLLAYWPGILVSDSMYQWDQVQTGSFSDWHPAYNTIYIYLLTRIWNNPGFVIFIQCILLSLSMAFVLSRLEQYYNINKKYLLIVSILFSIIPLNYNFAVTLLKDTLYSAFILLLTGLIIDMINDCNFFKNFKKCFCLIISFLLIVLFRHNGILVSLLTSFVLIIKYRKYKSIYIIFIAWLSIYLLLTTIGFKILNIQEGSYANKYGPISHVMARLLNTEYVNFSENDLKTLSNFVDVNQLKETFNPYNMDNSINTQNIENLKSNSREYIKLAIKKFSEYPKELFKHYICLTSFLYSPIPFTGSSVFGMFVETDLWEYSSKYPNCNEQSKIPFLLPILKKITIIYQSENWDIITMRPAIYMYLSIAFIFILYKIKKNKSLLLILLPSLFNTLSLAPAIPVFMTRYVYATMLVFYFIFAWFIYEIFIFIKDKKNEGKI